MGREHILYDFNYFRLIEFCYVTQNTVLMEVCMYLRGTCIQLLDGALH